MTVQNLPPDSYRHVAAGEIQTKVHVYRTTLGDDGPGSVGWQGANGDWQQLSLAVGETVAITVDGAAGVLLNLCPATVQLLWNNIHIKDMQVVPEGGARELMASSAAQGQPARQRREHHARPGRRS
ncbi:hypothetical protein [Zoogloea sp.]|uniref:hypothetical protein n=1 Tax=Zoogloea sp. TaxID=49181 RepID=UPI0014161EC8|nr:MAG: hypothetical protein F9K15_00520 [Zoogloea sp.]